MPKRGFDVDSYVSELISFLHSRNNKLPEELPVFYPGYRPSGPFALPEQIEAPAEEMTPKCIMTQILTANKYGLSKLSIYKETCRVCLSKPFQLFLLDSFWWLFLDHCASVDLNKLRRQRETGVMQASQQAVKMTSGEIHDETTRRNMLTKEELALKSFENDKTETVLRKSYSVKKKIRQRLHATIDDGVRHAHSRVLPQHLFDASDTESVSTNASTHFAGGTFGRQVRRRNEGTFLRGGVGGGKSQGMCSKIAPDRSETPSVIFRDSEWRRSTLHLALTGAPAARNFEELRDALTDDILEEFELHQRRLAEYRKEHGIAVTSDKDGEEETVGNSNNSKTTNSGRRKSVNNNTTGGSFGTGEPSDLEQSLRFDELLQKSKLDSTQLEIQKYDSSSVNNFHDLSASKQQSTNSFGSLGDITSTHQLPAIGKQHIRNQSGDHAKNNNHDESDYNAPPSHRSRRGTLDPSTSGVQTAKRKSVAILSSPNENPLSPTTNNNKHNKKVTVKQFNNLAGQMLMPSESRAFYAMKEDMRAKSGVFGEEEASIGSCVGMEDANMPSGMDDPEMRALLEGNDYQGENDNFGGGDLAGNNNNTNSNNNINNNNGIKPSSSTGTVFEAPTGGGLNDQVDSDEEDIQNNEHFYRHNKSMNTKNGAVSRIIGSTTDLHKKRDHNHHVARNNNDDHHSDRGEDDDSDGGDSVLSAASSIRTADDVLRVTHFANSDARQDLYGLPPDVRRSIVAREQHVLFSRMADRYVEAMNVQNMVFSRQQDRLIRVLPDMIAQFMFAVFYKALPCFRETVSSREFQASLFRSASYWIGGVERECLNPYSWRCHFALKDGLYQHNAPAHGNTTFASAVKKKQKARKTLPTSTVVRVEVSSVPKQEDSSVSQQQPRERSSSLISSASNTSMNSYSDDNNDNSIREGTPSSQSSSPMRTSSNPDPATNSPSSGKDEQRVPKLALPPGIEEVSSMNLESNGNFSVTSSASRRNSGGEKQKKFTPKPPSSVSSKSTSPMSSKRTSVMTSNNQYLSNNNINNIRKSQSAASKSGVVSNNRRRERIASVSFGDFLVESSVDKIIEKEADAFQIEMKKSFVQRKQFKTGKGMVESLLMPGSAKDGDDDDENNEQNKKNINEGNDNNIASNTAGLNSSTTSAGALRQRSQSIRAGAGLQRRKSTRDAFISIEERERRAGKGNSIFANLDGNDTNNNDHQEHENNNQKRAYESSRRRSVVDELDGLRNNKMDKKGFGSKPAQSHQENNNSSSNNKGLHIGPGSSSSQPHFATAKSSSSKSHHSSSTNNNNQIYLAKHIQAIKDKLDAKVKTVPWYGKANQRVPNNDTASGAGVTSANFLVLELSPLFQRFAASRISVSDENASTLKDQVLHSHHKDHYRGKSRFSSYPVRPPGALGKTLKTMRWTIINPPKPEK